MEDQTDPITIFCFAAGKKIGVISSPMIRAVQLCL
jgi:hypothetical protein